MIVTRKFYKATTTKENSCLDIPINNRAKTNLSTSAGRKDSQNRRKSLQWKKDIRKELWLYLPEDINSL